MPTTAEATNDSSSIPNASLLPWRSVDEAADIVITVYIVTGYHGKLRIPESFCRECNLFVRAADQAAKQVEVDVHVTVRSWWSHIFDALRCGGYHPPVMVVGERRLCQGHDLPTTETIVEAVEASLS